MFELLINLILTGLFLQSQAEQQATLNNLSQAEYQLPQSAVSRLEETAPQRDFNSQSLGVKITAQSALVIDAETDKILFEKNPQAVRSIASITKLMTALVFLDYNSDLNKEIIMVRGDYRAGGKNYLMAGDQIKFIDVLYAALVASANEAAAALARSTGLSESDFAKAMDKKAADLNMANTHFIDATGLNNDNVSTATDIIILLKAALEKPVIAQIISSKEYKFQVTNKGVERKITNTDKVLGQTFGLGAETYRVNGGKTGYTEKAGYGFASQVSNQDGKKILIAVLGSESIDSRFTDTKGLAYWVFNNYDWAK